MMHHAAVTSSVKTSPKLKRPKRTAVIDPSRMRVTMATMKTMSHGTLELELSPVSEKRLVLARRPAGSCGFFSPSPLIILSMPRTILRKCADSSRMPTECSGIHRSSKRPGGSGGAVASATMGRCQGTAAASLRHPRDAGSPPGPGGQP